MCCLFTILLFLGPRVASFVWWLADSARFSATFDNFLLPFIGWLFLPWTLLMYVLVAPGGVDTFEMVLLAFTFILDISSYFGGYRNRGSVPYRRA
ncbi:hypothetical protein MASR2M15_16680 [Anaerolineales bacterium]